MVILFFYATTYTVLKVFKMYSSFFCRHYINLIHFRINNINNFFFDSILKIRAKH